MADDRKAKEDRAIAMLKHQHFTRYGVDAVDEAYVRRLPDSLLDKILNPDKTWQR